MKRLALLAFAMVMACGDDGGNPPIGAGSMSASIDGTAFSGTLAVTASRSGTTLSIAALGSNSRQLSLNLVDVAATGNIAIGAGSASMAQYSSGAQAWVSNVAGGSGTVVVTTLTSTRLAGTFSFTAVPSTTTGATGNKAVTSGAFDVTFR